MVLHVCEAGSLSRLTCVNTSLEEDGDMLKRLFHSYLGNLFTVLSERREQDELTILDSRWMTLLWPQQIVCWMTDERVTIKLILMSEFHDIRCIKTHLSLEWLSKCLSIIYVNCALHCNKSYTNNRKCLSVPRWARKLLSSALWAASPVGRS